MDVFRKHYYVINSLDKIGSGIVFKGKSLIWLYLQQHGILRVSGDGEGDYIGCER